MRFFFQATFLFTAISVLSGCALAPFTTGLSARSLPKGSLEVDSQVSMDLASGAPWVPSVRVVYGLGSSWDLALHTELNTLTLLGKYSLWDSPTGLSLAGLGGVIYAGNALSYTIGALASLMLGPFEPFVVARWNWVAFDRNYFNATFFLQQPPFQFSIPLLSLGVRYWWTSDISTSVEFAAPFSTWVDNSHRIVAFSVGLIF